MAPEEKVDLSVSQAELVLPQDETEISRKKKWLVGIVIGTLLLAGGVGFFFWQKSRNQEPEAAQVPVIEAPRKKEIVAPVEAPSIETQPLFGEGNYKSENFQVGEIAIGGEAAFLLSEDNPAPLEIENIRGEAFTEKNKQEVKLVVSWKTNKLALSEVEYSKGVGQPAKTLKEEDYSLSHSVIIPGLDQASTYVYTIKTKDRFGNEKSSDPHAVYTGSRTVSLFDLIADAVGEVFGWAVKKK